MTRKFLTLCLIVSTLEAANVYGEEKETFLTDFRFKDGSYKPLGFRIQKIKQGSIYQKIGLLEGDIIKRLNQHMITNSSEANLVFNQLKTLKKIDLLVQRNGQEIPIHYRVK